MAILVGCLSFLSALLLLLVVGLLRSHAALLQRVTAIAADLDIEHDGRHDPQTSGLLPVGMASPQDAPDRSGAPIAAPISGTSLDGEPLEIDPRSYSGPTLVAFLSSGCLLCERFWRGPSQEESDALPSGLRVIAVTKDRTHESPSRLMELSNDAFDLVMSSDAWAGYAVPVAPYFVHVASGNGRIVGEGAAETWTQLAQLLKDAGADVELLERSDRRSGRVARASRVDEELARAGLTPDDPTLYGA